VDVETRELLDRPDAGVAVAVDDILVKVKGTVEQGTERVESTELLGTVIGIHASRQRDIDFKRLGRCMRRLGWAGPKVLRIRGELTKGYQRDENQT
jgi:hypothetical protein